MTAPAWPLPDGQWACQQCGSAWLGTPPADELCPGCQDAGGGQ